MYEAHLRHAVRERLPWAEWGPVRNGIAELRQVPEDVRAEFSQRRRRILERKAALEAVGVTVGRAGRERIVYETREPKREVAEADWREQVRARASEHGFGRRQLARLARLPASQVDATVSEQQLTRRLLGPYGVTARRNTRIREHHLAGLREHRDRLLEQVPDPEPVLQQAAELRERQVRLGWEHRRLYERAIEEELATRPPWLEDTLGLEPDDSFLRERWQRTAREIAGHRIRHHIAEPNVALDNRAGLALQRSVKDMRAALGIDRHGQEHGVGYE